MIHVSAVAGAAFWFVLNGLLWYLKLDDVWWLVGSLALAMIGYPAFFWYVMRDD
jgi:hypothetical protein